MSSTKARTEEEARTITSMMQPLWRGSVPHPHWGTPPTCLASLLSAGNLRRGTAPCPAGRRPQRTSAAPSASPAVCVPFPEPSGCAPHPGWLRRQNTSGQGWERTDRVTSACQTPGCCPDCNAGGPPSAPCRCPGGGGAAPGQPHTFALSVPLPGMSSHSP